MYFQIENTPERIRKARRIVQTQKSSPKEECPRLILAPFSRPPQVVFDNVALGATCERTLELYNPSKQAQQITLSHSLPDGLIVQVPNECIYIEPETCYCLTLLWTPAQPTAQRDTIRFTNENRGRYDVIVILKTVVKIKGKGNSKKIINVSPGKIVKKSIKKSPVGVYKKKVDVYSAAKVKHSVNVPASQSRILQPSNRDNTMSYGYSSTQNIHKCPFDSPNSVDFNFDTTEIFSNMRQLKSNNLQQTYDKSENLSQNILQPKSYLQPPNKQSCNSSATDIFDNLTFTPLKGTVAKNDNIKIGPKIILSVNSDSEFDDSLNAGSSNKENETHSFISITSTQPPNQWLNVNHLMHLDKIQNTPSEQNKKIPNTSSPKELNSPNFSINTEFSRISDLSFLPQRFSTERKILPKFNNETHDVIDDGIVKLSSDTYTKESPNTPINFQFNSLESKPPHYFLKEQQPKMCRHSLFKEYHQQKECDKIFLHEGHDYNESLSRPITPPPLQSIPEESVQFSDTQGLIKTDKQMTTFTLDRTFDYRPTVSRTSWSKKSVRAEPDLWKIPTSVAKKSKVRTNSKSKISNVTFEANQSINQNSSILHHIGNVYSQSFTVDPFLSSTYFYDEQAVDKFEKEFKRWLNCILTPPADLDCNIEQKVDVGKAWLENRNKEVPLAPTKEHVSSVYHNSHRLESLRRAARSLLLTPEMAQVFLKLNAQIEKQLIAIRNDRNLHLDVGLQKVIMELLLSYNPLWLRIGLEAIYGTILPLRSNSDIDGLTTFIIQRMFKNPFLKTKLSNKNIPNMLSPAYMKAIKKFTLKKFFMLVFFLDQAKQKKLISHDPCLFCRNALCKESREVIIRFTRELIAGIGDITKHLRPLGYVVSHKQSYLDEYKYAVHNIATDLRDGVRLTKVMEIILMKNGLLHQLRTPAISRLQKIHNVQVALTVLKETDFVIVGDINAHDIADGHREKTLSLLWQLIHVFRAPLFEKAANVIQIWWKKKYEVILERRREEEKIRHKLDTSALAIQRWWRRIQYNRLVEWQMRKVVSATTVLQKYCRMWLCRTQYNKMKISIIKIENWYISRKVIEEAKQTLSVLKREKELLILCATILLQKYYRMWACRRHYIKMKTSIIKIKEWYTSRKLIHKAKQTLAVLKQEKEMMISAAIIIQKNCRKWICRTHYKRIKKSVIKIEEWYISRKLIKEAIQTLSVLKRERETFISAAIILQKYCRKWICSSQYIKMKTSVITIEEWYTSRKLVEKAKLTLAELKHERETIINATIVLQKHCRKWICRSKYIKTKNSVKRIKEWYASRKLIKKAKNTLAELKRQKEIMVASTIVLQKYCRRWICRSHFVKIKNSIINIEKWYTSRKLIEKAKLKLAELKQERETLVAATIVLQKYCRKWMCRSNYNKIKNSVTKIQKWYTSRKLIKDAKRTLLVLKLEKETIISATIVLQKYVRKWICRKRFNNLKSSVIKIEEWYTSRKLIEKAKLTLADLKREKQTLISATVVFQKNSRMWICRRKYNKIKSSVIKIEEWYKSRKLIEEAILKLTELKQEKAMLVAATIVLQKYCRKWICRSQYIRLKKSVSQIEVWYKSRKLIENAKQSLAELRREKETLISATIVLQKNCRKWICRTRYIIIKSSVIQIEGWYISRKLIQEARQSLAVLKQEKEIIIAATIVIQKYCRKWICSSQYIKIKNSVTKIEEWYISRKLIQEAKNTMEKLKREKAKLVAATVVLQKYSRKWIYRSHYNKMKTSVLKIEKWYKSRNLIKEAKHTLLTLKQEKETLIYATIVLQKNFRMWKCRSQYNNMKNSVNRIEEWYTERKLIENAKHILFQLKREKAMWTSAVVILQKYWRGLLCRRQYQKIKDRILQEKRVKAIAIQKWWKGILVTRLMRHDFVQKRNYVIKLQSVARGYLVRKRILLQKENFLRIKEENRQNWAASKIQALFRGHKARVSVDRDTRVSNLRRRWREGALKSTQETLKERNEEAMEVLRNMFDIETVIRAFRSLELLTEVFPMMYHDNASSIVRRVYIYMSVTNRSISSIEVMKSAASVLVNLTRYRNTGPKIYARDRISPILKYMWRFSNSETRLFCILSTYIWLFSKYDSVKEDLTAFLHLPENYKMMATIKDNVGRMKRMANNSTKNKYHTPQTSKFVSHTFNQSLNLKQFSSNNCSIILPAIEPDYGIVNADKPRYFEDAQEAMTCLFLAYRL